MFKEQSLKKILALILVIALSASLLLAGCQKQPQNEDPTVDTEETTPPETGEPVVERVALYWNVDRALYASENADAAVREKDAEGYFHVRFAVNGETVEYKVSGARVMETIDKTDLMGLEFDENGCVIGVVDVAELTAGEVAIGEYVVFAGDTSITTCPNKSLEGSYTTYQYASNVGIFNVMGQEPVGFIDTPQPVDTIRAFVNDAGEITHIFILTRLTYFAGPSRTQLCPECQQEVVWREWADTAALPNQEGHFYLAEDIDLAGATTLESGIKVCVDLNGKTVSATKKRMYVLNSKAELTLIDSVGTGKMVGYREEAGTTTGGMFYLNKGDGQTLNIYSGTYDASQINTQGNGGLIAMNENQGTFNLYGGTLIGAATSGKGGVVYAATGSTFNMEGGEISGGHATESGDNVYVQVGATFTQTGGVIDGGIQDGNILLGEPIYHCLCASTTDQHFGECNGTVLEWTPWEDTSTLPTISGNYYLNCWLTLSKAATLKNANVNLDLNGRFGIAITQRLFVLEGSSTLNIVDSVGGGRIGGVRTKGGSDGAMILMNTDSTGTVSLYSGILEASLINSNKEGGVLAIRAGSGTFNMYGGGLVSSASSKCADAVYLNAGGTFNMYGGYIFDCNPDPTSVLVVVQPGAKFNHYSGIIHETPTPEPGAERQACLCGSTNDIHVGECDGTVLTWTGWVGTTMPKTSGNYYLTEDMVIKNENGYKTVTLAGEVINLDLNGHTVTGDVQRIYVLNKNSVLNITDTVGGGVIKGVRESGTTTGGMFYFNKDGNGGTTVSLYGGTLDASAINVTGKGAVVAINENQGAFNMYGGKVIGGISASGDAVYLAPGTTFNMTGGEMIDSNPDAAKKLVVAAEGATFNQTGGTITENAGGADPEPEEHIHCLCGASVDTKNPCSICGSVAETYTAWDGTTTPDAGGNYFLTGDAKATETLFNVTYDVNICLNGHTLTAKDKARAVTMTKGNSVVITGGCGTTNGSICAVQGLAKTGDALFAKKGNLKLYNLNICNNAATVQNKGSLVEIGADATNVGSLIAVNCTLKASNCSKDVAGYALVRVKASSSVNGETVTADTVYVQTEGGWNGFVAENYNGHEWTDATCATPKTCSVCGATEGDALGHTYPDAYAAEDADADKHYHVCSVCQEKDEGEAHTWNQEAATETEDKYCTICNYIGEPRKNHEHEGTKVEAVASTCVTAGNIEYWTCTCGKWFSDAACTAEITDKTTVELPLSESHSFTNYVPNGDATCTADGTETAKCDHCDVTDTRADAGSAGHSWSNDTCTVCNVIRHCLCGSTNDSHTGACNGTALIWQPWTDTVMPSATGNYYLTADMLIKNATGHKTATLAGVSVNLDLHGHTVNAESQRIYVMNNNAVLNIMDSVGGGKIVGVRTSKTTGAMFYLNKDGNGGTTVSLYGGTLDASQITIEGNGAVVAINKDQGSFHMYGGKIISGICDNGDVAYLNSGTAFSMYDGEIVDSNTDSAKQLIVALEGATFNHVGGTITEYALP